MIIGLTVTGEVSVARGQPLGLRTAFKVAKTLNAAIDDIADRPRSTASACIDWSKHRPQFHLSTSYRAGKPCGH